MAQRHVQVGRTPVDRRPGSPWRWGLLLTLRDRLQTGDYNVPADAVAESIIDRAVLQHPDVPRERRARGG